MASERDLSVPTKEMHSLAPSDTSFDEKEKAMHDSDDDNHEQLQQELERVESAVYPTAWKLYSILLAVILSIFLVALDMVSTSLKAALCIKITH